MSLENPIDLAAAPILGRDLWYWPAVPGEQYAPVLGSCWGYNEDYSAPAYYVVSASGDHTLTFPRVPRFVESRQSCEVTTATEIPGTETGVPIITWTLSADTEIGIDIGLINTSSSNIDMAVRESGSSGAFTATGASAGHGNMVPLSVNISPVGAIVFTLGAFALKHSLAMPIGGPALRLQFTGGLYQPAGSLSAIQVTYA